MSNSSKRQSMLSLSVRLVCCLTLCWLAPTHGMAQSTAERIKLENKIPAHLPFKVEVKNLQTEQWERDLEIVVENTGDKPIYYLNLALILPEMKDEAGSRTGFRLKYGRSALLSINNLAQPDDVPIKPGERHTFKLEEQFIKGYQHFKASLGLPDPTRAVLIFVHMTFGDGTGYGTTGGLPLPNKRASINNCGEERKKTGEPQVAVLNFLPAPFSDTPRQVSSLYSPVSFSPAFLRVKTADLLSTAVQPPDTCCQNTSCSYLELLVNGYTCNCGEADYVRTAPCYMPQGACGTSGDYTRYCYDEDNNQYSCPEFYINPCGSPDIQ